MIAPEEIQRLQSLPIEEVAERLGIRVRRHRALCPFHSDHTPSLTFDTNRNRYRCYVCGAHGNPIDLVEEMLRKTFPDACEWLGGQQTMPQRSIAEPKPRKEARIDRQWLRNLVNYPHLTPEAQKFLFEERKINPKVVRWLGISSIAGDVAMGAGREYGVFNGPALLLPYYDEQRSLISVQARYLGSDPHKPRFQFPKGGVCRIYNLPITNGMEVEEDLYLTEGATDCMALLSSGRKAIAIPSATLLKQEDVALLKTITDSKRLRLHIYPDQDEPGERLFLKLREAFPDIKRHQLPIGVKDFGQYWQQQ